MLNRPCSFRVTTTRRVRLIFPNVSAMTGIKHSFNSLTLDQKILTLIIIQVIGFCAVAFVAFSQVRAVGHEVKQMASVTLPLYVAIENVQTQTQNQYLNTRAIIFSTIQIGGRNETNEIFPRAQSDYIDGEKALRTSIASAEKFIGKLVSLQGEKDTIPFYKEDLLRGIAELKSASYAYNRLVVSLLEQLADGSLQMDIGVMSDLESSEAVLMNQLLSLNAELEDIRIASTEHAIYVERIAVGFIILTSIFAIIFFISIVLLIVRHNISKPLQLLTDTINAFTSWHKVEESEFEKELIERHDELGRMSRSFNRLKHDLWQQGQDLKEAKDQAERANRAKSVFLASASHDLRQPLNAMQMYIAALQLKVKDEGALKIVKDINAVSVSTAHLLSALLDVSQLEAGAIKPRIEDFSVQDVLRRVFRSFAPVAKEKGLQLRLSKSSACVRSDPVLLERIIGNFTSNAIRYTEQGSVLIGCRRRGTTVSIEVLDTGCGIPDSQILPVFDDFYQLNNKERDRGKGLGLGLAIAKRLSACLGHELECNSNVGRGSRFAVLVGAGEAVLTQPEDNVLEFVMRGLSGICVLLIEDDIDVLKATQQLMVAWGCNVYFGRNLDDVLRVVDEQKTTPPDIIVADNRLPGEANGMEVAARVQTVLGRTIPTVIVTGDVDEAHIRGIADKGYSVLCKPVRPAKLRALISHVVGPSSEAVE